MPLRGCGVVLKKLSNVLFAAASAGFLACMIAQPILEYRGVDRHWIDTLLLVRKSLLVVLLAGGLISAGWLFAPKNKDRREVMGRQMTLARLPLRDQIVSGVILLAAMMAAIALTMVLVTDVRLQALIDGLAPFF